MSTETKEDPVLAVVNKVREMHKRNLSELDEIEKVYLETHKPISLLDSEKLSKLPWKDYPSGTGGWIFADSKGAEELWAALKQRPQFGRIELDGWVYRLSHGGSRDFISRTPISREKKE